MNKELYKIRHIESGKFVSSSFNHNWAVANPYWMKSELLTGRFKYMLSSTKQGGKTWRLKKYPLEILGAVNKILPDQFELVIFKILEEESE